MNESPNTPAATTVSISANPSATAIKAWLLTILGALLSLGLILTIILLTFQGASVYQAVLVTVLVSFFPISYLAFEVRAGRHKDRLVSRINLLGFADAREQERWENMYRQLNPAQEYILFVSLAALVSLFGFGLLRFSLSGSQGFEMLSFNLTGLPWISGAWFRMGPGFMLDTFVARTMFYSFLGAYVFSIYNVARRYVTYDMMPGVYLQASVLMITVIAFGYVLALYLSQDGVSSVVPPAIVPILAFLIGYIPDFGFRLFKSIFGRTVREVRGLTKQTNEELFSVGKRHELPLETVNGISIWHETRLRESGIDNVQNLESMDIRQLLLTSRLSMPQVINWVDQAILLSTLPFKTVTNLRKLGIQTMTALIRLLEPIQTARPEQLKLAPIDENAELSHEELVMLATLVRSNIGSSPNLAYVIAYWQAIQQLETEQIRTQTKNVLADITRLAAVSVFANDRTLELLTNLVRYSDLKPKDMAQAFARDFDSAIGLANAYSENAAYQEAIDILNDTINLYSNLENDLSPAYASRGLANGLLAMVKKHKGEDYTKFIDDSNRDFKAAIQANPRNPVTYIFRGALLYQRKEHQKALAELDKAIEINPTIPKAFLTRGKTFSILNQHDKAIADFDRAIELARPRDLQRILEDAYYERATLLLNSSKLENAESDFNEEIFLDSQNPLAYLGRGKVLLLRGKNMVGQLRGKLSDPSISLFVRAIYNFEAATSLYQRQQKQLGLDSPDSNLGITFSNMAQAYFQLERYEDAFFNVNKAFELKDHSLINFKIRGICYKKIGELQLALGDLRFYQSNLPATSPELPMLKVIIEQIDNKLNQSVPVTPPTGSPPPGSPSPS